MPLIGGIVGFFAALFGVVIGATGASLAMLLWAENTLGTLAGLAWNLEALIAVTLICGGTIILLLGFGLMLYAESRERKS